MARVLNAFEAMLQSGSVALCFSSNAAHMMPVPDVAAPVLDQPLSPTFFEDLAAVGIDVDEPTLGYILSKAGVQRLARCRARELPVRSRLLLPSWSLKLRRT